MDKDYQLIPIDENLGRRIASDVDYILQQRWAYEISDFDFNHGHVCLHGQRERRGRATREEVLNHSTIPGIDAAVILYHTHELDEKPSLERNITSYSGLKPGVVHPAFAGISDTRKFLEEQQRIKQKGRCTVKWQDLGLEYLFDVEFKLNRDGKYQLSDGRKIDIYTCAPLT